LLGATLKLLPLENIYQESHFISSFNQKMGRKKQKQINKQSNK
jgi:hypothetical protein